MNDLDPYHGNTLIRGLGPIISRKEILQRLTHLPPRPKDIATIPRHVRLHHLIRVRDLHIPSLEGARLVETIDLLVRPGYMSRDPKLSSTWGQLYGVKRGPTPASAALVVAHSGAGKTQAIWRGLSIYPSQVIKHESFPHLIGPHYQVVHQSIDVPPSGKLADLAANLMMGWDAIMEKHVVGYEPRFDKALSRSHRDGAQMMDEWRQVARSHFLGILHLDEVQNFFKLPPLDNRKGRTSSSETLPVPDGSRSTSWSEKLM